MLCRVMAQIIHNDLGRTKDLIAARVAALSHFKDDLIGLSRIVRMLPIYVPAPKEGLRVTFSPRSPSACRTDG